MLDGTWFHFANSPFFPGMFSTASVLPDAGGSNTFENVMSDWISFIILHLVLLLHFLQAGSQSRLQFLGLVSSAAV